MIICGHLLLMIVYAELVVSLTTGLSVACSASISAIRRLTPSPTTVFVSPNMVMTWSNASRGKGDGRMPGGEPLRRNLSSTHKKRKSLSRNPIEEPLVFLIA